MTAGKIFRKEKYDVSYPTVDKMREGGKRKKQEGKVKVENSIKLFCIKFQNKDCNINKPNIYNLF